MTETTETADNNAGSEPAIHSPGRQLRQAREARGLSEQEAAVKLHLHQRIITWLEADEFDQLPSPIYVRGYLRNYARLLGLDAEKIVSAYDGSDSEYPELKPPLTAPSQASSSDKPVKAVTYLVTLVLVLLLLAWWQSRNVSDDSFINLENLQVTEGTAPGSAAEDGSEETRDSSLGYPIKVIRHPESPIYPRPAKPQSQARSDAAEAPANEPTDGLPDTATTPAPLLEELPEPDSNSNSDSTGVATDTTEAATPSQEATTTPSTTEMAPESPTETATETPATTPDQTDANSDGLRLDLTEESWIEVYAADGERLYIGLGKPGDTIEVDGQAPLRVLLGYAPGVEVSYDGETINTVESTSAGVAEFTVGR